MTRAPILAALVLAACRDAASPEFSTGREWPGWVCEQGACIGEKYWPNCGPNARARVFKGTW